MSDMSQQPSTMPRAAIVVVALVILIGVGSFAYMSMNNSSSSSSSSSSSTSSSSSQAMMSSETSVMVGGAAMYSNRDIVSNVSNASNLTTLVAAVKAGDLVSTLQSAGPFTVFGPDNDAFAQVPAATLQDLLKPENKAKLVDILTYHVVAGKYTVADLKDGQTLKTVQGGMIKITKTGGKTMINGAEIKTPDVLQSNGVAHVISKVLMPSDSVSMVGGMAMYANKDIVSNVTTAPNLTTVVTALKAADLVTALQVPGPITVFGPDNDAFAKLPAGTVETLVKPENKAQLQGILTYHVVAGMYKTSDLKDGLQLKTVNGATLTVKKSGDKITLVGGTGENVATIITGDVLQSNGVAHVIDTVLLPPAK